MNDVALRKAKLATAAKWGLGLLAALVVSPIIFMVVKGIVGLAIAAVLGLAAVNLAPYLSMKFANWKLGALKHEARANPIETRQNLGLATRERIRLAQVELSTFSTEVKNFEDEVKELRRTQPEDAADFENQLRGLKNLLQLKIESLQTAVQKADAFDLATERAERKWKVAQSALRMQKLTGQQQHDAMDKILAEESLDSVQTALNRAMAEMEAALAVSAPPALAHNPSPVIDVTAVEVKERLHIK